MTAGAVRWFDSHCHAQSADDAATLLDRAREAGVGAVVCVGTDLGSSRDALALATGGGGGVWATVGLHPHHADRRDQEGVAGVAGLLAELGPAAQARVVAVGECGLDYHYDHAPRPDQRRAFAAQVALAHQAGLALVIHTREAWEDTIGVLVAEGVPARTVFHCFTGGPDEARRCLDLGAWLSFSGITTFKAAGEIREAARRCPQDRLLVETDAPYLAPVPNRGKPNEPAWVPLVGRAVAEVRGQAPEDLAHSSWRAAEVVFGLGGDHGGATAPEDVGARSTPSGGA